MTEPRSLHRVASASQTPSAISNDSIDGLISDIAIALTHIKDLSDEFTHQSAEMLSALDGCRMDRDSRGGGACGARRKTVNAQPGSFVAQPGSPVPRLRKRYSRNSITYEFPLVARPLTLKGGGGRAPLMVAPPPPSKPLQSTSRLGSHLLCAYSAFSPDRHRALADCEAGVWLLTQTLPGTDRTVFGALRERAATPAVRIWAAGAPFETKDKLRARGYRWMPADRDGIPRSWWTDVAPADLEDEFAWLAGVYQAHGRLLSPNRLPRRDVTARDRWRADPIELRA